MEIRDDEGKLIYPAPIPSDEELEELKNQFKGRAAGTEMYNDHPCEMWMSETIMSLISAIEQLKSLKVV